MASKMCVFLLLAGLVTSLALAQETGRVMGIVLQETCPGPVEVKLDDRGAAGVDVWLDDAFYTQTQADGSYVFEDVPVGTYTVGVFVNQFGVARAVVNVRVGETRAPDLRIPLAAPGDMLVRFVPSATRADVDALNEAYGVTLVKLVSASLNLYLLRIPEGYYLQDLIDAYNQEPMVQYASPNDIVCPL